MKIMYCILFFWKTQSCFHDEEQTIKIAQNADKTGLPLLGLPLLQVNELPSSKKLFYLK